MIVFGSDAEGVVCATDKIGENEAFFFSFGFGGEESANRGSGMPVLSGESVPCLVTKFIVIGTDFSIGVIGCVPFEVEGFASSFLGVKDTDGV